jgi:NitT/TauT family transport system substrate-binding protein
MGDDRFDLLSLQEAMDILGISRATIDRWRKAKQLPHIKIGKEVRFDKQQLHAWVRLHAQIDPISPPAQAPASGRTIRVGYQSGAALLWSPLIIRKLGFFEEELRKLGPSGEHRVLWYNAPNGMELVEDLISGQAHIASIGDYPMMAGMALGRIMPRFQPLFLAFDGKTTGGEGISLVVPNRHSGRRQTEWQGLPILTVGHSSASRRLRDWLKANKIGSAPVIRRNMSDCYKGIMTGEVGASMMWEPYLSWAKATGRAVPIASEEFGGDYLTGLMADRGWAEDNEDIVVAYLKAHLRAHAYMRNEPSRASETISAASGVPIAVVFDLLSRIRWDASLYGRDLQTLLRLGDDLDGLPRETAGSEEPFRYAPPYLQQAITALKLPTLPDLPLPGAWSSESLY